METWLFEAPWWLLTLIAITAVALLVSGNNRQQKNLKVAGLVVFLGGIGLWAMSYFVDTPREICQRLTRNWVTAVVAKDSSTLESLLHSKANLARWNHEDIVYGATKYAEDYGLQSATVTSMKGEQDAAGVTVTLSILSKHNAKMAVYDTVPSTWQLNWVHGDANTWLIKEIVPLKIGQSDRGQFQNMLFNNSPRP